ncbi:DUF5320 domain-containing protein [Candidatus Bipolaricaulota bacterium]|nr:DUF5320 domain-containing protein [Candidatus Bipolaricaulota bacterium]
MIPMRWRNMFYATGLPGWMRFGYSPGWGGMPPGATYLSQTGQVPAFAAWWAQQAPVAPPWGGAWGAIPYGAEDERSFLSARAKALESELQQIKARLDELAKESQ